MFKYRFTEIYTKTRTFLRRVCILILRGIIKEKRVLSEQHESPVKVCTKVRSTPSTPVYIWGMCFFVENQCTKTEKYVMTMSALLLGSRQSARLLMMKTSHTLVSSAERRLLSIRPRIASKPPSVASSGIYFSSIGSFDASVLLLLRQPHYEPIPIYQESRILTCSSVWSEQERTVLSRILANLRHWIHRVYDALLVAVRSTEIVLRLAPLAVLTPTAILATELNYDAPSDFAWWYTLYTVAQLGPAFIKLAQWVATRRDIFPAHICDRFGELHDNGLPHSISHTVKVLQETFGENYRERLDIQEVIGCGSAAQVYRGLWKEDGTGITKPVAVKVLHPNYRRLVERDFQLMTSVADLLHSIPSDMIRMVNLPRVAENFCDILRRQTDLRLEGDNLTQFRANFYGQTHHVVGGIIFPKPFYSGETILVEDLVQDAQSISNFLHDETKEGMKIRRELAGPLLRAFLKMVFLDNFVHCDLHPGNVLVTTTLGPNNKVKRSIVFIDAGIAVSLSPQDQQNLKDLFRAVLLNEGDTAGRLMVARAKFERCSQIPGGIDAFAAGVEAIVSDFHDNRRKGLTLGAVRIGALLSRVLDLCRVHGVEIDPAMASIVLSTLVLEGLGRSLDPDMNLLDFAIPFVLGRGRV
jgi:aarF domain-containing kinase